MAHIVSAPPHRAPLPQGLLDGEFRARAIFDQSPRGDECIDVAMEEVGTGNCVFRFTPQSIGAHDLSVMIGSRHIGGSPFRHGGLWHTQLFKVALPDMLLHRCLPDMLLRGPDRCLPDMFLRGPPSMFRVWMVLLFGNVCLQVAC